MIKDTLDEISNDLRAKRDALANFHQKLKFENDNWNKGIITLSLMGGFLESAKLQLGWETAPAKLAPIAISSIIAIISSLVKFKKFPEQMETLITAQGLLTQTLTKARNETSLTPTLLKEYYDALEKCESALYPSDRKTYLKTAHKNLIAIAKQEKKYYATIDKVNLEQNYGLDEEEMTDVEAPDTPKRNSAPVTSNSKTLFGFKTSAPKPPSAPKTPKAPKTPSAPKTPDVVDIADVRVTEEPEPDMEEENVPEQDHSSQDAQHTQDETSSDLTIDEDEGKIGDKLDKEPEENV